MSRRSVSVATFVLAAVAASCSSSSPEPDAADYAAGEFSFRGAFDAVTVPESFAADRVVEVTVTDLDGVAAAVGVDVPSPTADFEESGNWFRSLFGDVSIADGGTGFGLRTPRLVHVGLLDRPQAVIDEFGWSPLAVTSFAEIAQYPNHFTVMAGDLAWTDDAIDLGGGVRSIGDGDDFSRSVKDRTELRELGEVIRVGSREGLIAASPSTPPIAKWVDGTAPTLLDDERYLAVAEHLDDVDAIHADVLERSFDLDDIDEQFRDEYGPGNVRIGEEFDVVGIGVSVVDGKLVSTIVYVFADDDAASRAAPQVDDAWTLTLNSSPRSFRSFIEVGPAEQRGRAVVVSGPISDEAGSAIGWILASSLTTVFLHT